MSRTVIETAKHTRRKTTPASCTHCGEPVSFANNSNGERVFCCSGCQSAYEMIHVWNLEQFYDLRDQIGSQGQPTPNQSSSDDEIFDRPELLGLSAPRDLNDGLKQAELALQGLHCGACAWLIENAAHQTPGWISARVKMNNHTVSLTYQSNQISLGQIARILVKLGYQPVPLTQAENDHTRKENRRLLMQIAVAGFCAANTMWIAIALYAAEVSGAAAGHYHLLRWTSAGLGLFAVLGPGQAFFRGATASIRTRTPHMDLPVAVGLSVGTVVGMINTVAGTGAVYFDSLAVLVFLLLIGRWIQFRQQHRAAKAVDLMLRITPNHAKLVLPDGSARTVEVQTLREGQIVRISAGDNIPVDGIIQSGSTTIDRSLLTGESKPIAAKVGDEVCAGTVNVLQPIDVSVTATGGHSRIGKVMKLVESASENKPPMVQLADKIGGVFVVTVTLLALATFVFWFASGWQVAAENATSLLIVACPCALALATPLAIAVSIGRSAKRRILVRDGALFEHLAGSGQVWFDKTGTLTVGRPEVTNVLGEDPDQILAFAAAVEKGCAHPLAVGIVAAAQNRGITITDPDGPIQTQLGGIHGAVAGHVVEVGNHDFVIARGAKFDQSIVDSIAGVEAAAESPILVAIDHRVIGVLAIADRLRDDALDLVDQLTRNDWQVGILSGDHPKVVSSIAKRLGIDDDAAHGALSPEEKLSVIRDSQQDGCRVVMIGDGANDAAALAAADVGIAVRGGAEVSLRAAPIYVASGKLTSIGDLIGGASSTQKLIYTTFIVSLSYNLIAVALAATGNISPLIAAILMPISSVSVLAITLAWPTFGSST